MNCPACKVDVEKKVHEDWCPNKGVGDSVAQTMQFLTSGWCCPNCKRVWSPLTAECKSCNEKVNNGKE